MSNKDIKTIKLGICGAGLCATNFHLPALKSLSDYFTPVAISSSKPDAAIVFAGTPDRRLRQYVHWQDLVSDDEVEAVLCSYPYFLSADIIKFCVEHGKHILVEKPLADSVDAANMLGNMDCQNCVVGVAENWLYLESVDRLKYLLSSGEIGTLQAVLISSLYSMQEDSEYLTKSTWRKTAKGGILLDRAIHTIAFEHAVVGKVSRVCGLTCSVRETLGESDTMMALLQHENGVIGTINICASAPNISPGYSLAFIGTTGTIKVSGLMTHIVVTNERGSKTYELDPDDGGYRNELLDFYYAITNGSSIKSSLQRAAIDLRTALAAVEFPGQWVSVS